MKPLSLALDRFRALVEAYGTDLSRFPGTERDAARALVESSAEARALLDAEAGLDARFASVALPELSPSLQRRLLEVPLRAPERRAWWPFTTRWVPALSWAGAVMVGVWLGTVMPDDDAASSAETAAAVDTGSAQDDEAGDDEAGDDEAGDEDDVLAIAAGEYADLWEAP